MRRRVWLGLSAIAAVVVFVGVVSYEEHILWNEYWTVVIAEATVGLGGLVLWTFKPEIMAFIGKAPTLLVELSQPMSTVWNDNTTHSMGIDVFTLTQVLPAKGKMHFLYQQFRVTAINSTIANAGAKLWIDTGEIEFHPAWSKLESTVDGTTGNVSFRSPPQLITLVKGVSEVMNIWVAYKGKDEATLLLNTDIKNPELLSTLRDTLKRNCIDLDYQFFGEKLPEQPHMRLRLDISSHQALKAFQPK